MQQVLSNTTKVMVDDKQGGNLLYLPLDKLMNMTQQGAAPTQVVPQQVEQAPQRQDSTTRGDELSRSRDAFRNRDRESRP